MIFLTVGTQLPFDRLVKVVDEWNNGQDPNRVFGQIADRSEGSYDPLNFSFKAFVEPDEFAQHYADAKLIVAHAGMGSIISALTQQKPIVIMPRKANLNEHRNDHQLATAQQFESRKGVYVAKDENMVGPLLDELLLNPAIVQGQKIEDFAAPELLETIRDFIFDEK